MRPRAWRAIFVAVLLLDCIYITIGLAQANQFVTKWGSEGSGDGQFSRPYGVAVNTDGNVYVTDYDNSRVQVFTPEGQFVTKWGSKGSGDGQFQGPCTIAVNATGHVYIGDEINARVQVYTSTGQYITEWAASNPNGLAVNGTGYVYVSQYGANRINVFTSTGQLVNGWGGLEGPNGVAVNNATGHVYVTERFANRVSEFTSTGQPMRSWGSWGIFNGQFRYPYGIAINQSGFVFTTELDNPRVQVFTSTGEFVGTWGSYGEGDGQFHEVTAIALDAIGYVYCTDNFLHRVQVFNPVFVPDYGWVLWTILGIIAAIAATFLLVRKRERIAAWWTRQKAAREKQESDAIAGPPSIPSMQDADVKSPMAGAPSEDEKDRRIKELEAKVRSIEAKVNAPKPEVKLWRHRPRVLCHSYVYIWGHSESDRFGIRDRRHVNQDQERCGGCGRNLVSH